MALGNFVQRLYNFVYRKYCIAFRSFLTYKQLQKYKLKYNIYIFKNLDSNHNIQ